MAVSYVTSVKPWLLGNGLFPTLKVDAHLPFWSKGFCFWNFFSDVLQSVPAFVSLCLYKNWEVNERQRE